MTGDWTNREQDDSAGQAPINWLADLAYIEPNAQQIDWEDVLPGTVPTEDSVPNVDSILEPDWLDSGTTKKNELLRTTAQENGIELNPVSLTNLRGRIGKWGGRES